MATIQGQRVGHSHTIVRQVNEAGRPVVKVAQTLQLSIRRYGAVTKMDVDYHDTETPDGRLIDFELTSRMGATPMHTTGKVAGTRLDLQFESQGQTQNHAVSWPAQAGGLLAPLLSLRAAPLKPGEHRTVKHLNFDGQVCTTELTAQKEEDVKLWSGSARLLKVDSVEQIASDATNRPPAIKATLWTDAAGEVLKTLVEQMDLAYYRVSADVANQPVITADFDLGKATLIKVDRPIRRPHDTLWVRYRIHLDEGNPVAVFPAGPSQEVTRVDEHTAEVTVRAIRPAAGEQNAAIGKAAATNKDAPTDDDRKPNNFIQSDDPRIVAQAKEAVGEEVDPWKEAVALESYVHRAMKEVDFSQAFATAAEAAQSRVGDCKAHAVYLAALARARGIPARVAVGLVYMPQSETFGGHMWSEVYIGGRWIGLDGTLGKGGIGGGHLKLSHSSLAGVTAYDAIYSMLQIMGRLKIQVLDSE